MNPKLRCALFSSSLAVLSGCGDGPSSWNFDTMVAALENPSGIVNARTVPVVAREYQVGYEPLGNGWRRPATWPERKQSEEPCPAGGTRTDWGNEIGSEIHVEWDNCCERQCCRTGHENVFYRDGASRAPHGGRIHHYAVCAEWDVRRTCEDREQLVYYRMCHDGQGQQLHLVEAAGGTYAVRGSYLDGRGSMEVAGANGVFVCDFEAGNGYCIKEDGTGFEVNGPVP